jgi:pyrroloquinoline quinone biosynthesis protein B
MFLGHEAMGAESVPVYAMPRMHEYLSNNGPWSQLVKFNNIDLILLENEQIRKFGEFNISPFLVPHRDEYSETVGYRIQGPTKSALFIPDIDKWLDWDMNIIELLRTTDYALIDASFFADGELGMRDMSQIPHPFVTESMELFDDLSEVEKNKVWFIHMNHTNPLLDPNSEESKQVLRAGFNIATEGIRLPL